MSKGYTELIQVKRECKKVTSCAAGSDGFMYKRFPLLIEQLIEMKQEIIKLRKKFIKEKRQPTEYQLRLGKYMKEGKSIKEAHKLAKDGHKEKA